MSGENDVSSLSRYLLDHDNLSHSQRAIAEYLCEHPWEGLTQTAAEIGAAVGVSASTVVRFAQGIGFKGLADLQQLLGSHVRHMLRSRESLERVRFVSEHLGLGRAESSYDVFLNVMQNEIAHIEKTRHSISPERYEGVVDRLTSAKSLYVLGLRGSLSLAVHFTVGMRYVRPDVFRLDNSGDDLPDKLASLTSDDVLVAFSYSPYTSTTVKTVRACQSLGVHVIAITDSERSPVAKLTEACLVTHNPVWFSSATGGSTALVNSLIYAAAAKAKDSVGSHIDKARDLVAALESFELNSMDNLLSILADEKER